MSPDGSALMFTTNHSLFSLSSLFFLSRTHLNSSKNSFFIPLSPRRRCHESSSFQYMGISWAPPFLHQISERIVNQFPIHQDFVLFPWLRTSLIGSEKWNSNPYRSHAQDAIEPMDLFYEIPAIWSLGQWRHTYDSNSNLTWLWNVLCSWFFDNWSYVFARARGNSTYRGLYYWLVAVIRVRQA